MVLMSVRDQVQMYQLSRLLHDHHKDLYDHFEMNDVAPTLYAAPWFLTIFASQFPIGFVARVFGMLHNTHNLVSLDSCQLCRNIPPYRLVSSALTLP